KRRMFFHIRPNNIVPEKECAKIINIDRTTGIIQLDSVPSKFNGITKIDLIQTETPNKILSFDTEIVDLSFGTRTLTVNPTSIPKRLKAGDYVCRTQETPYPNIPTELHPVLAQRAAIHILEAMGDNENIQTAR